MQLRHTITLFFTSIALVQADDKLDFKPVFAVGKTYHQQMEMTQDMPMQQNLVIKLLKVEPTK